MKDHRKSSTVYTINVAHMDGSTSTVRHCYTHLLRIRDWNESVSVCMLIAVLLWYYTHIHFVALVLCVRCALRLYKARHRQAGKPVNSCMQAIAMFKRWTTFFPLVYEFLYTPPVCRFVCVFSRSFFSFSKHLLPSSRQREKKTIFLFQIKCFMCTPRPEM